ncbi:YicC/YloC family endoribonuclease [Rufibacter latericius]|uniref:YicC family protein n=1 Tax=Rufibacter latericius TaxID=2487040 RepID=A0A3M9ML56_9BACT|nr:YicC/YloC family endoribonuclease [Rufibacter latericius]RNI26302.1 YicC family protein [Rufibacter latericius]
MLLSMTGFGAAHLETEGSMVSIELKSLNSKSMDLSLRIPRSLSDKELEIRNLIGKSLVRGKINLTIEVSRNKANASRSRINTELLTQYYREIEQAALALGAQSPDLFRLALHMPDVLQAETAEDPKTEEIAWEQVQPLLQEAIDKFNTFRADEGKALTTEIISYIDRIRILLAEVDKHDPTRVEQIKQRIQGHLSEISSSESFNQNRFEQEMIYYIEKLDIAEEKVRLVNHLHYFTETVYLPEPTGKKLAFISQEIGREINTIGSKANDATIQHLVVEMKEELEKIKEQLNNIL